MEEDRQTGPHGPIHHLPINRDLGREIQIRAWEEAFGYLMDLVGSEQIIVLQIGRADKSSGVEIPGRLYYDGHHVLPRWVDGTDTGCDGSGHAFRIGEPLPVGLTHKHNAIWFRDGDFVQGNLLTQDGDDYFYLQLELPTMTLAFHELI